MVFICTLGIMSLNAKAWSQSIAHKGPHNYYTSYYYPFSSLMHNTIMSFHQINWKMKGIFAKQQNKVQQNPHIIMSGSTFLYASILLTSVHIMFVFSHHCFVVFCKKINFSESLTLHPHTFNCNCSLTIIIIIGHSKRCFLLFCGKIRHTS